MRIIALWRVFNQCKECKNIEISGLVRGNIKTEELTIFKETSNIIGNINTNTLMVEPGATLKINCNPLGKLIKSYHQK